MHRPCGNSGCRRGAKQKGWRATRRRRRGGATRSRRPGRAKRSRRPRACHAGPGVLPDGARAHRTRPTPPRRGTTVVAGSGRGRGMVTSWRAAGGERRAWSAPWTSGSSSASVAGATATPSWVPGPRSTTARRAARRAVPIAGTSSTADALPAHRSVSTPRRHGPGSSPRRHSRRPPARPPPARPPPRARSPPPASASAAGPVAAAGPFGASALAGSATDHRATGAHPSIDPYADLRGAAPATLGGWDGARPTARQRPREAPPAGAAPRVAPDAWRSVVAQPSHPQRVDRDVAPGDSACLRPLPGSWLRVLPSPPSAHHPATRRPPPLRPRPRRRRRRRRPRRRHRPRPPARSRSRSRSRRRHVPLARCLGPLSFRSQPRPPQPPSRRRAPPRGRPSQSSWPRRRRRRRRRRPRTAPSRRPRADPPPRALRPAPRTGYGKSWRSANPTFAGRSASRRMYHGYQCFP